MSEAERHIFATWHFGNVVWPVLSEPECVGLQINSLLVGRQWRCAAVQSGSFLWGGIGHKGYGASGLLMLFKMGVQASAVCLCCSCWCVKWNSGSWAGLGPSLYLPPSDYFTPLIFLPPPLIWEDHWNERERGKEKKREGERGESNHWLT